MLEFIVGLNCPADCNYIENGDFVRKKAEPNFKGYEAKLLFEDDVYQQLYESFVRSYVDAELTVYPFITEADVDSFFLYSDCMLRIRDDWEVDFELCFGELSQ